MSRCIYLQSQSTHIEPLLQWLDQANCASVLKNDVNNSKSFLVEIFNDRLFKNRTVSYFPFNSRPSRLKSGLHTPPSISITTQLQVDYRDPYYTPPRSGRRPTIGVLDSPIEKTIHEPALQPLDIEHRISSVAPLFAISPKQPPHSIGVCTSPVTFVCQQTRINEIPYRACGLTQSEIKTGLPSPKARLRFQSLSRSQQMTIFISS